MRARSNLLIDALMVSFFLITALNFRNSLFHSVSGILFFLVVLLHALLHRKWIIAMIKYWKGSGSNGASGRPVFKTSINWKNNIALGILFAVSSLTGLVLISSNIRLILGIHVFSSILLVISSMVHFALHLSWIATVVGSAFRSTSRADKPTYRSSEAAKGEYPSHENFSAINDVDTIRKGCDPR